MSNIIRMTLSKYFISEVKLEDDSGWTILIFKSDGTIRRCNGVSSNIGLAVDMSGRIVVDEEYF